MATTTKYLDNAGKEIQQRSRSRRQQRQGRERRSRSFVSTHFPSKEGSARINPTPDGGQGHLPLDRLSKQRNSPATQYRP